MNQENEFMITCGICGHKVDARNLGDVMEHEAFHAGVEMSQDMKDKLNSAKCRKVGSPVERQKGIDMNLN